MKKTILFSAAIILLVMLAGCGRQKEQSNVPTVSDRTEETADTTAGDDAAAAENWFVGSWRLADDSDLSALSLVFPNAAAFGGGMEIRSDGMISWYIGSDGAVGSYTIQGGVLSTDVVDELDGEVHRAVLYFQEADRLTMSFKDMKLVWIHDDGSSVQDGE